MLNNKFDIVVKLEMLYMVVIVIGILFWLAKV